MAPNCKKTLWKREKMLVTAFSPFPAMFSIGFTLKVGGGVKTWDCLVKRDAVYEICVDNIHSVSKPTPF